MAITLAVKWGGSPVPGFVHKKSRIATLWRASCGLATLSNGIPTSSHHPSDAVLLLGPATLSDAYLTIRASFVGACGRATSGAARRPMVRDDRQDRRLGVIRAPVDTGMAQDSSGSDRQEAAISGDPRVRLEKVRNPGTLRNRAGAFQGHSEHFGHASIRHGGRGGAPRPGTFARLVAVLESPAAATLAPPLSKRSAKTPTARTSRRT
jgi:hypothetical protein